MTHDPRAADRPGILVFPPLLFFGSLVVALILHWILPWRLPLPGAVRAIVGPLLFAAGVSIALWGERTMKRAGTNVNPYAPSTAIVSDGPFRYSRNPLYLSLFIMYTGVLVGVGTLWPVALLAVVVPAVMFGIVLREERYLEAKFGEPYRAYRRQVRRWF